MIEGQGPTSYRKTVRYHLKLLGKKLSNSHREIIVAIIKQDEDLVERAIRTHYAGSGEIVAKIVEQEEKESG